MQSGSDAHTLITVDVAKQRVMSTHILRKNKRHGPARRGTKHEERHTGVVLAQPGDDARKEGAVGVWTPALGLSILRRRSGEHKSGLCRISGVCAVFVCVCGGDMFVRVYVGAHVRMSV